MKLFSCALLVCIFFVESSVSFVYSEGIPTANKDSQTTDVVEGTEEGAKEIRIKKDEFEEIVEQLQGMKELLVNMKQDYDTRFQEMQEKIATLEKEKAELKKTQLSEEDRQAVAKVDSDILKVPISDAEEESMPPQSDTHTTAPLRTHPSRSAWLSG